MTEKFVVCEVTRQDLVNRGYYGVKSDGTMRLIAREMSELITTCDFWTALDIVCERLGIPKTIVS